jgi:hypothetical protein
MYAVVSLALIAGLAWVCGLVFEAPADRRAVRVSAVTAFALQLVTFAIARAMPPASVMVGWGLGALLRLGTLAVYGMVMLKAFALPSAAAMFSLALFLFASTVVEPLFLKR